MPEGEEAGYSCGLGAPYPAPGSVVELSGSGPRNTDGSGRWCAPVSMLDQIGEEVPLSPAGVEGRKLGSKGFEDEGVGPPGYGSGYLLCVPLP